MKKNDHNTSKYYGKNTVVKVNEILNLFLFDKISNDQSIVISSGICSVFNPKKLIFQEYSVVEKYIYEKVNLSGISARSPLISI